MTSVVELKNKLATYSIDGYLIPSQDEYQNEYVPQNRQRLKFVSGFTGSNGLALVTKNTNILFTDGRYLLQAKNELDGHWQIENYTTENIFGKAENLKIGYNPKLFSIAQIEKFATQIELVPILDELVLIKDEDSRHNMFIHEEKYTGRSAQDKIGAIIADMQDDAIVITALDSICWLLNIRGDEVPYNPLVLGYLIVYRTGHLSLFLEQQPPASMMDYFDSLDVIVSPVKDFALELKGLVKAKIQICNSSPYWLKLLLPNATIAHDPCILPKACKNQQEIAGAIRAHEKDGSAVTKFLQWLEGSFDGQTEISLVEKLLEFRRKEENFIYPSFATIAGFAENGAIIHYHATEETNKKISGNNLLLLDSGGQYLEGTTDITRTIAIGTPTVEQIHDYTLVLKGLIALSMTEFEENTTGAELDKIARQFLAAENKDYAHGTGHGVGSFLSVHEGPQRISKSSTTKLLPGMIISIEPGYYKEGFYGIRIENLVYVARTERSGYLKFITLTKVPYDHRLIDFSLLDEDERQWLDANYL